MDERQLVALAVTGGVGPAREHAHRSYGTEYSIVQTCCWSNAALVSVVYDHWGAATDASEWPDASLSAKAAARGERVSFGLAGAGTSDADPQFHLLAGISDSVEPCLSHSV